MQHSNSPSGCDQKMKKQDIEHLIRAITAATNQSEIIIIGSQSILGSIECPPERLAASNKLIIYSSNNAGFTDFIDRTFGEGSPFHEKFRYYAQGVGPETSTLPNGWQDRLVKLQNKNTDSKIGYCLAPHDLAIAKLVAWREKDVDYLKVMVDHDIIQKDRLICLAKETRLTNVSIEVLLMRIDTICQESNDERPRHSI